MSSKSKHKTKLPVQVASTKKAQDKKSFVKAAEQRTCFKCEEVFDKEDAQVSCEICHQDFHHDCFGVPSSIINRLSKMSYILCCESCNGNCKNFLAKIARNEERIDKIETTLAAACSNTSELQNVVSLVQSDVSNLGERLENLERDMHESKVTYAQVAQKNVELTKAAGNASDVNSSIQITKGINDRESRKQNVVFSGIAESEDVSAIVKEVLEKLNVQTTPTTVKRIGAVREGFSRKVFVRFPSENVAEDVLRKKYKLRESSEEWMRSIYINEDLSREQRDFLSNMYQEMESKNEKLSENAKWKYIVAGRRSRPFIKKIDVAAST